MARGAAASKRGASERGDDRIPPTDRRHVPTPTADETPISVFRLASRREPLPARASRPPHHGPSPPPQTVVRRSPSPLSTARASAPPEDPDSVAERYEITGGALASS